MSIQKIVGITTRRVTEGLYEGCVEAEIHSVDMPAEEMTPFLKELQADYEKSVAETVKRLYDGIGNQFTELLLWK